MRNSLVFVALLLAGCASQDTQITQSQQAVRAHSQSSTRGASQTPQSVVAPEPQRNFEDFTRIDLFAELTAANAISSAYVKAPERKPGKAVAIKTEAPLAAPVTTVVSTLQSQPAASTVVRQREISPAQSAPVKSAVIAGSAQEGLEMAQRIAVAHGCDRSVVLDYQTPGGVIYMASCQRGVKKILCQGATCRVMD